MYHFIGIKGSGMSSLAQIMNLLGMNVQGSDVEKHFFTETGLVEKNIKILPFSEDNIVEGLEIIQGNTFNDEHVEVKKAKELGLKIYTYQEMVGKISEMFNTIAVAGCHGKTTTTALLSHVLGNIMGCNYLIGDGTGFADKKNKYFALEACEYKRHFLEYIPTLSVITNIELDHVDYYKDINDVMDAYQSFVNNTKKCVIACGDNENVRLIKYDKEIIFYGINENNDIVAKNIIYSSDGIKYDVYIKGENKGHFEFPLYGKHMVLNTLAVIAVCNYEGVDLEKVKNAIQTFKGAKRRFFETKVKDNVIIDDYAHHPTEANATIEAVRQKYPDKKLIAVFQPHTYTRTIEFADEIASVLSKCDKVFIMDIHGSREKSEDFPGIDYTILTSKINDSENIKMEESEKLLEYKNSVILFMSPNDLSVLENSYVEKYKEL